MEHKPVYYGEYLQLDKIIQAQHPVSFQEHKQVTCFYDKGLIWVIRACSKLTTERKLSRNTG